MQKIVLLDRDGVINYDSLNYIKSIREFHFIPGALEALGILTKSGYRIGIASNQSGISRGLYTEEILLEIHNHLLHEVEKHGGAIDAIEYCPHMPESGCACRKPEPGMILKLLDFFEHSGEGVYFLGDRITDIEAAIRAGVKPALICSPMTYSHLLGQYPHVPVYSSLLSWVRLNIEQPDT